MMKVLFFLISQSLFPPRIYSAATLPKGYVKIVKFPCMWCIHIYNLKRELNERFTEWLFINVKHAFCREWITSTFNSSKLEGEFQYFRLNFLYFYKLNPNFGYNHSINTSLNRLQRGFETSFCSMSSLKLKVWHITTCYSLRVWWFFFHNQY